MRPGYRRRPIFWNGLSAAAHKLNDFDFGAAPDGGDGPKFTPDDGPVQFDRHPLRLKVERANHVE